MKSKHDGYLASSFRRRERRLGPLLPFAGDSRGYTIESDVHHDQIRALAFSETDRVFAGADNIN